MTRSGNYNISNLIKKMSKYLNIFALLFALFSTSTSANTTISRDIFTLRPTNELTSEPQDFAHNLCHLEIMQSKIGKTCSYLFPSFNIHKYVDYCVEDMKEKKFIDTNVISSALCELEGDCLHFGCKYFLSKGKIPETRKSYIPPHIYIQQNLCPITCDNTGLCTNVRCLCDNDFKKRWMSHKDYDICYSDIKKDIQLTGQSQLLCDITKKCPNLLHIYGKNFWASDNLKCKIDNKVSKAIYKSPTHVICVLPINNEKRLIKKTIKIKIPAMIIYFILYILDKY